jgi:hypothetical protein
MSKDLTGALTWADSAASGTAQELEGGTGAVFSGPAIVHVHNPSAVTALTVTCRLRWTDDVGTVRDSDLLSFAVPANSTKAVRVEGFGMGRSLLRATNDTALGIGQGFTARARVEFHD